MSNPAKTAIVTGASQGIGAGIAKAFVARGFNAVASSRKMTQSMEVEASHHVARVEGMESPQGGRGGHAHHAVPSGPLDKNSRRPSILVAFHRR